MKIAPLLLAPLFLLALVHADEGAEEAAEEADDAVSANLFGLFEQCPSGIDLQYTIAGLLVLFFKGYVGAWVEPAREAGEDSISFATCEELVLGYDAVKEQLGVLVQTLDDGTSERSNNLGVIRMNPKDFQTVCELGVFAEDYCGIALGAPASDHELIRPFLDEVLGVGGGDVIGGDITNTTGNRWDRADLIQSAETFLADKTELDTGGTDLSIWLLQEVHRRILGIELTDDEASDMADKMSSLLIRGFIYPLGPFRDKELDEFKRSTLTLYQQAIRSLIAADEVTTLVDDAEGKNVLLASVVLLDAFTFAARPSVTSTIKNFLGTYYGDPYDFDSSDLDVTNTMDLSVLLLESIRFYPPVVGVPFVIKETGIRIDPLVGVTGYDEDVYGPTWNVYNPKRFGSLAEYKDTLLNWANAALPLAGKPHTSHVCPAKAFSFNLVLSFLLALDPTQWSAPEPPTVPDVGNGPGFFSGFQIVRN